jgi:hypothetical protein
VDGNGIASGAHAPPVVVYSGHMVDHPTRGSPRFPPALEGAVRDVLRARLTAMRPVASYGSAACGTDLLVLELVRQLGGETHIVLPFPAVEFREVSIDFAGRNWAERFERALSAADSVTVTSDHRASGVASPFEYANLVFTGMARSRAHTLQTALRAFAVLDSGAGGAAGGTAAIAALWRTQGLQYEQVDIAQLRRDALPENVGLPAR